MSDLPVIKPYNVECRNGNEYTIDNVNYRLLKNGAVYDMKTTRIVGLTLSSHIIESGEHASAMAKKRWKIAREAGELGLNSLNSSQSALDVWSDIVKHYAQVALERDDRDGINAAKFVGNAVGYLASSVDVKQLEQENESNRTRDIQISLPSDSLALLVDAIRKHENADQDSPDIIDVTPIGTDTHTQ